MDIFVKVELGGWVFLDQLIEIWSQRVCVFYQNNLKYIVLNVRSKFERIVWGFVVMSFDFNIKLLRVDCFYDLLGQSERKSYIMIRIEMF